MTSTAAPVPSASRRGTSSGLVRGLWRDLLALAALCGILALLPLLGVSRYWITLAYYVCYVAALGQAWNLMAGMTGYLSFAHGAFAGIGAYTVVLASNAGVPLGPSLALGACGGAVAALFIGATSLRLQGVAFTLATLFFQAIMALAVKKSDALGGAGGLVLDDIVRLEPTYLLAVGVLGASTLCYLLVRAVAGVRLLAIKDDEVAAAACGIGVARRKIALFCASGALAGVVGGMHAIFLSSIYPDVMFSFDTSLDALIVPLIGGVATATGPILGGLIFVLLREALQTVAPGSDQTVMGLLILFIVLLVPGGAFGLLSSAFRRVRS